jgi:hypothetical protein
MDDASHCRRHKRDREDGNVVASTKCRARQSSRHLRPMARVGCGAGHSLGCRCIGSERALIVGKSFARGGVGMDDGPVGGGKPGVAGRDDDSGETGCSGTDRTADGGHANRHAVRFVFVDLLADLLLWHLQEICTCRSEFSIQREPRYEEVANLVRAS